MTELRKKCEHFSNKTGYDTIDFVGHAKRRGMLAALEWVTGQKKELDV